MSETVHRWTCRCGALRHAISGIRTICGFCLAVTEPKGSPG